MFVATGGLVSAIAAGRSVPALGLFPLRTAWSVDLPDLIGPAAFFADRAFVRLASERLASYDLRHGTTAWDVPGSATAAPVADGSQVFVVDGTTLTAYDHTTGARRWSVALDATPATAVAAVAGWLFIPFEHGQLAARRAADGAALWTADLGAAAHASPTVGGDRLFVPLSDGRVVALAVGDGTRLWERRLGGAPGRILVAGTRMYVGTTDNFLYALQPSKGVIDWRWRTGADIVSGPAMDDDRVYFVSLDNVIRALDRGSGAQRWRRTLPGRSSGGPIVASGTVLVSALSGAAQAFLAKDGAPAGDMAAAGSMAGPLHAVEPPLVPLTLIVRVTRSLKGTRLTAMTRDVEPQITPVSPLPNAVPLEALSEPASEEPSPTPEPGR